VFLNKRKKPNNLGAIFESTSSAHVLQAKSADTLVNFRENNK